MPIAAVASPHLALKMRYFRLYLAQALADLANLARRTGGGDLGESCSSHDQRAGKDRRQIMATRTDVFLVGACLLAHGFCLARQQRFVCGKVGCLDQQGICGYPVAFRQHDQIAAHHVSARNALSCSVADHKRAGAGEIPQRFKHAAGSGLLCCGDGDRHAGESKQDQRFCKAPQQEIDNATHQKQSQHRFAQHIQHDAKNRPVLCRGKFI